MKNRAYNSFRQHIHEVAKTKGFPLRVMFELTYRCNFRCKHCYVPASYRKKKGELNKEEVFLILDLLKDIGCFYLGFTGGEPFVREDIMDILWYAKRCGFEVIIYTNGSLIDERKAEELAILKPNKVDITIPAMSREAFENISGVAGSRNKVFRAIKILHTRGVMLGFKSCVLKENESEIKEIQNFAESLDALHRLDIMFSPRLDGSKEPYKYRAQKTEDRRQKIEPLIDCQLSSVSYKRELRTKGQKQRPKHLFKCGVGQTQMAITPQGELKMCLLIDYPKYKIQTKDQRLKTKDRLQGLSLKEAWKRLKELVASIRPDENYQCDKCELRSYCKWCPARGWLESRSFTTCDPESRRWAEMRRQWLRTPLN